jgi:hypothetical protein
MIRSPLFDTPSMISPSHVIHRLRVGNLQVPQSVRTSTWSDDQRVELLNSVFASYPIGSLMTWSTFKHELQAHDDLCGVPVSLPLGPGSRTYLVDGYERVMTLLDALTPRLDHGGRQRYYYDLDSENDSPIRLSGDVDVPTYWVPLDVLLDFKAMFRFQETHRQAGNEDYAVDVMRLSNLLKDVYTIPIINLVTDDVELVMEAARRINGRVPPGVLSLVP